MMPGIAIANQWVYNTFLDDDYQAASQQLTLAQEQISELNDAAKDERSANTDEDKSALQKARDVVASIGDSVNIDKRMDEYGAAAERISENTIRLVVVFLMQTLVFPLVFLVVVINFLKRFVAKSLSLD